MNQITIDFSKQNNASNQSILDTNKERFSNQCRIVLDAFLRGERLTTTEALVKYGIGDLRARVRDLINAGVEVDKEIQENRFKIYSIKKTA